MTTLDPIFATVLGVVEGLTQFLPVSSTGHLILASRVLGLRGEAMKTFQVIIQAGALGAVLGLYRARVASMWRGLLGHDAGGRRLFVNLTVSFMPTAIIGAALHDAIKAQLFREWPVVWALALGGLLMIGVDAWYRRDGATRTRTVDSITIWEAFVIGCVQCLALWPGMSRAMVTLVAGLLLGLPATAAAEYSFLLAMPTIGAATLFDVISGGHALLQQVSFLSVVCGFAAAGVVAVLAVRGFLGYLTRHGLAPFGWYRLGVAAAVWAVVAAR